MLTSWIYSSINNTPKLNYASTWFKIQSSTVITIFFDFSNNLSGSKTRSADQLKLADGTQAIILNDLENTDDFKSINPLLQSIFFKIIPTLAIALIVIPIIFIALVK